MTQTTHIFTALEAVADMNETKHTPTPLFYGYDEDRKHHVIHDDTYFSRHVVYSTNGGLPEDEMKATMQRMALCYNAHDDLVVALKGIITAIGAEAYGDGKPSLADAIANADAALAKAKAQP